MNLFTKARILAHIVDWRIHWNRRNLDYREKGLDNPKFMTAREAVRLIPDGAVCASSGMAGNTRSSVWYWAIREQYEATGHPRNLTHISVGAQGSRGRVPGTLEELALDGLITTYIAGHAETVKAMLKQADRGTLELHTMPQGVQTFLFEAQARGEEYVEDATGVGTFLDPRVGSGSGVHPKGAPGYIEAAGDKLRYRLPKVTVAYFIAPAADREGNIYVTNCAMHTESHDTALAARANGGKVLVSVAQIVEKDEANIFLPADKVDAIAVHPYNEQTASIPQRKYWPMFTQGATEDLDASMEIIRFFNTVLKITPKRTDVDNALARLASATFTRCADRGARIVVGVGLPEEVARLIHQGGLFHDVYFISETGVHGGLPTPGIFFGAGLNPKKIMTSAQSFHFCRENLDVAILGLLEADSDGNVNVSRRGEKAIDYVGPGGFPDFCVAAKTLIFVGSWMAHAKLDIRDGRLVIDKPGPHKFADSISEITFSAKQALQMGKTVLYITNVGVFKLTKRGMELTMVMPGVDIQKDIMDDCPMRVVLPEDGNVPVVGPDIVTGEGYRLQWTSD